MIHHFIILIIHHCDKDVRSRPMASEEEHISVNNTSGVTYNVDPEVPMHLYLYIYISF